MKKKKNNKWERKIERCSDFCLKKKNKKKKKNQGNQLSLRLFILRAVEGLSDGRCTHEMLQCGGAGRGW